MRKLLAVALPMQGVQFFYFAVNRNSDAHPNVFLGIILFQNICQNVYDSGEDVSEDRASIDSRTTDLKGMIIFKDFAADGKFLTNRKRTNFCVHNISWVKFLWVRAAHRSYYCYFFMCTNFCGFNFLWGSLPTKITP